MDRSIDPEPLKFAPSIPKIPSGRIRRDSEHCDMIWIDDRDHESAVVDRWIAIQVA